MSASGHAASQGSESKGLVPAFILVTAFVLFLITVAPYLGSHLLLDWRGTDTPAVVEQRSETVTALEDGVWSRKLRLLVKPEEPGPDSRLIPLLVDSAAFDRLSVGQKLTIRRHASPWAPLVSRLEARPAGQMWPERFRAWWEEGWPLFPFLWSGWLLLVVLWLFGRGGGWGCLVPIICTLAWLGYWLSPLSDEVPRGETKRTTAQVVSVTVATKLGDTEYSTGFPVVQPYQMAVVEFLPSGATNPVRALDRIDAGSFPRLRKGNEVEVIYQAGSPRNVRIAGGRRAYWWKNLFWWWPYAAAVALGWLVWTLACGRWPWLHGTRPAGG